MKRIASLLAGTGALTAVGMFALASPAAAADSGTPARTAVSEVAGGRAVPPPPAAGRCGAYFNIETSGASATVRECRPNSTQIYVEGSVTDQEADGQCAQVYASYDVYTGTDYGPRACPSGTRREFRLPTRAGTNAFIYLREVNA